MCPKKKKFVVLKQGSRVKILLRVFVIMKHIYACCYFLRVFSMSNCTRHVLGCQISRTRYRTSEAPYTGSPLAHGLLTCWHGLCYAFRTRRGYVNAWEGGCVRFIPSTSGHIAIMSAVGRVRQQLPGILILINIRPVYLQLCRKCMYDLLSSLNCIVQNTVCDIPLVFSSIYMLFFFCSLFRCCGHLR